MVAILPELPPDPHEACTQIYGGPERMTITGTAGGKPVDIEVTRIDGCQIARYDRLAGALAGG